jgi:hypothetical protein
MTPPVRYATLCLVTQWLPFSTMTPSGMRSTIWFEGPDGRRCPAPTRRLASSGCRGRRWRIVLRRRDGVKSREASVGETRPSGLRRGTPGVCRLSRRLAFSTQPVKGAYPSRYGAAPRRRWRREDLPAEGGPQKAPQCSDRILRNGRRRNCKVSRCAIPPAPNTQAWLLGTGLALR